MSKKKADPLTMEIMESNRAELSQTPTCGGNADYVVYAGKATGCHDNFISLAINDLEYREYSFRIPRKNIASQMALHLLNGKRAVVICRRAIPIAGDAFSAVAACSYDEYVRLDKIIYDFDLLVSAITNEGRTRFDSVPCELRADNDIDVILADSGTIVNVGAIPEVPVYNLASENGCTYIDVTSLYETDKSMSGRYMATVCDIAGRLNILSLTDVRLFDAINYQDVRDKMAVLEDIIRLFPEHETHGRLLYRIGIADTFSPACLNPIDDLEGARTVLKLLEPKMVSGKKQLNSLLSKKISIFQSRKEKERDTEALLMLANLALTIVPFSFDYSYVMNTVSSDPVLKFSAEAITRFVTRPGSSLLISGPRQTADVYISRICRQFELNALQYNIAALTCSLYLQGLTRRYENSDYGRIIKDLCNAESPEKTVFCFRNLDLASNGSNTDGDPIDFIPDILNNGIFIDYCMDIPVDVKPIRIIATAASENSLRDGFAPAFSIKINIPLLGNDECIEIAKKILAESFLSADDETVQFLLDGYCQDDCIGELIKYSKQISEILENGEEILNLTKNDVISVLGEGISTEENIYTLIRKNLDSYPRETIELIRKTLDEIRESKDAEIKRRCEKNLRILARTGIAGHSRNFDINRFRQQTSHLIGLSDQKERLESLLCAWAGANPHKPAAILLEGPPGTGKTSLVNTREGNIGGIPVYKRSLAGLTPDDVKGSESSGPGLITSPMADIGSESYILVLDEADKAFDATRKAILDAIDGQMFYDNSLKTSVSVSNVVFVFISNSFNMEPEFVDRLSVIEFPGYTVFDKEKIVSKLVSEYEETYGIRVCIGNEALELMLRSCAAGGVRDIEKAFRWLFSEKYKNYDGSGSVTVKTADIMHMIPQRANETGNGIYALAVKSGNPEGVTSRIVSVRNGSHSGIKHSGGLTDSTVESLEDAFQACRIIAGDEFESFGIYIKMGSSAIEKDGPSAGAAVALSMLFAFYGIEPEKKYGLSGEINPDSTIGPVGGLKFKLQAAYLDGITHVFIPHISETGHELTEYTELLRSRGMTIIEVGSMGDILAMIPELKNKIKK